MQYELMFDPGLPVVPEDFADIWNQDPEAITIAQATTNLQPAIRSTYKTSVMADTMFVILTINDGLESAIMEEDIYKGIRRSLKFQGLEEPVEILEVVQPDGSIAFD